MMDKLNRVDIIKTIRLEKIARVYSWVVSDRRKFSAKRLSRTQRNIKIMFQCARGDKTIREIAKENNLSVSHVRRILEIITNVFRQFEFDYDVFESPENKKRMQEFHKMYWYINEQVNYFNTERKR
jgi:predicted DNA-binding protein YlxM (UPF0122 family)